MSKFMEMIEKTDKLKLDEQSIEILKEMRVAFAEGVESYTKKEAKDDFWKEHYTNAKNHWLKKLDAINTIIVRQEGRIASASTAETTVKV